MNAKSVLTQTVRVEDRFIPDYDRLVEILQGFRTLGMKISMTQGVFDLLHIGHTRYISQAKSYGDILVVAVDSDEYTRARKARDNERRPVVPFQERLELLANLRTIDILTVRDLKEHSEDPNYINRIVRPDVLVMSKSTKDLTQENTDLLKGLCGELVILEPTATISTTRQLRDLMIDGATSLVDHLTEAIEEYFYRADRTVTFGKKGVGNGNGAH